MVSPLKTEVCITGSGPATHTVAIYAACAELKHILFEGWMANDIAHGGWLTPTSDVENFLGFPEGIMGMELKNRCRNQLLHFGTTICIEPSTRLTCLRFSGSWDSPWGFWNKGISACDVCDGAAPIFRNKPLDVISGVTLPLRNPPFSPTRRCYLEKERFV